GTGGTEGRVAEEVMWCSTHTPDAKPRGAARSASRSSLRYTSRSARAFCGFWTTVAIPTCMGSPPSPAILPEPGALDNHGKPIAPACSLPLHAARAPALDQVALDGHEEGDGRRGDHHARGHDHPPVHD